MPEHGLYQDWQAANQQREDEARAVVRQATEFDCHAAIRELAEVAWPCEECIGRLGRCKGACGACQSGTCCGGLGCIVPFVSLRVPCPYIGNRGEDAKWHQACVCQGRRWVPEPDVRVACWEIAKVLADQIDNDQEAALHLVDNMTEEAVLRAALAWVKEQRGHSI